jgi:hypothetical protein
LANYYTQVAQSGSVQSIVNSISQSWASGQLFTITTKNLASVSSAAGNIFDASAVRAFVPDLSGFVSASATPQYFPSFTKQSSTGTEVQFVISSSAGLSVSSSLNGNVLYTVQPKDSNR